MDYGCFNGDVVKKLVKSGVISLGVGIDKNMQALKEANNDKAGCSFFHVAHANQIPQIANGIVFNSVSILDVLEHVYDQDALLQNIRKVMDPDGVVIVTVPKKIVFSFLDLGNWKFVFPVMHKFYYVLRFSRLEYEKRYVVCADGLFGDVEKEKRWHQHFSVPELKELLSRNGFEVIDVDGSGFFERPLSIIKLIIPIKFVKFVLERLINIDACAFSSSNLFVTAKVR